MAPPDWLRTTMARIVPSLQLAKTEDHSYNSIVTPYTFNCYTLHLTSYILQVVREFFCIKHSSRGTILCHLANRASSLGWLVGNYIHKIWLMEVISCIDNLKQSFAVKT